MIHRNINDSNPSDSGQYSLSRECCGNPGQCLAIKNSLSDNFNKDCVMRMQQEYSNLFNNSFMGIFRFRLEDCRLIELNGKAMEIVGMKTFVRISFASLFFHAEVYEIFIQKVKENKKISNFDFQINYPTAEEKWASVSCSYFPEGNFIEGIILDVTENKKQVLELQRLNHELDQFVYHASHDLRSPLATILGIANLLRVEQPTEMTVLYTNMLQERVHHLDKLLKDIVAVTFNNNSVLDASAINFDEEVRMILSEFRQQFDFVKIYLAFEGTTLFYSDTIRLRTILRHLISNAFKYHNVKTSIPFIKINISTNANKGIITVEDNGIGIEEDFTPKIFDMFYRATTQSNGTGLGLYIVKSMVDRLTGKITVKSKRDSGSVFTVELPNQMKSIRLNSIL